MIVIVACFYESKMVLSAKAVCFELRRFEVGGSDSIIPFHSSKTKHHLFEAAP
jgi:hypothetical protein